MTVIGVTVGLSGCQSVDLGSVLSPGRSSDPRQEDAVARPGTATDEPDLRRRITVIHQDSVRDEYGIDLEAEMVRELVTPDQPARIRFTMTNEGEAKRIKTRPVCMFEGRSSVSDPPGLWVRGLDTVDSRARPADKWTALSPDEWGLVEHCLYRRFSPGESESHDYLVWDDADVDGYLIPDVHRFETHVVAEDHAIDFVWGVTVRVDAVSSTSTQ